MAWNCRYGWIFKTNPMKKVMICLIGCFLVALNLRAQDTTRPATGPAPAAVDSTKQTSDTAKMMTMLKDSGVVKPATPATDTAGQPKSTGNPSGNSAVMLVDSTYPSGKEAANAADGTKNN